MQFSRRTGLLWLLFVSRSILVLSLGQQSNSDKDRNDDDDFELGRRLDQFGEDEVQHEFNNNNHNNNNADEFQEFQEGAINGDNTGDNIVVTTDLSLPRIAAAWNKQYCTIQGCKQMTDKLLMVMGDIRSVADFNAPQEEKPPDLQQLLNRNSIPDPLFHLPTHIKPLPRVLQQKNRTTTAITTTTTTTTAPPYFGVMLDVSRHYFDLEWIRNLLQLMSAMGYNLLHLRLTGDSAFRIRLSSFPELATGDKTYAPSDLKALVAYAHTLNIIIMPEINIPGHAGGWHGIPGLLVPCAKFICDSGQWIPLNLKYPHLMTLLESILKEVVQIFYTSPYLHLGGNDMRFVRSCVDEAQYMTFAKDYKLFEADLQTMTQRVLTSVQIVRWSSKSIRTTNNNNNNDDDVVDDVASADNIQSLETSIRRTKTAGTVSHSWSGCDTGILLTKNKTDFFCTPDTFHMDNNIQATGWQLYEDTRSLIMDAVVSDEGNTPLTALIVGTNELNMEMWFDRNVVGRLLAIAIGMSTHDTMDMMTYLSLYDTYCEEYLQFDKKLCRLQGAPTLTEMVYRFQWRAVVQGLTKTLCSTLTELSETRHIQRSSYMKAPLFTEAMHNFWRHFGEDPPKFESPVKQPPPIMEGTPVAHESLDFLRSHSNVPHTGIILDLVHIEYGDDTMARMISTLNLMNQLGFNTLQLRIMSDFGFAIHIPRHESLVVGTDSPFPESAIQIIVTHAQKLGIQIIPEITTATRGGGWHALAIAMACPNVMCETSIGVTVNATDPALIAMTISVLHELVEQFHHPPYIHLGYDERQEAQICLQEANQQVDFDEFERNLIKTLEYQGFDESKLIRWENAEATLYPHRSGKVTHYRLAETIHVTRNTSDPFFISSGLFLGDPSSIAVERTDSWDIFEQGRTLVSLAPTGILASVNMLHPSFWSDFAISERLVALAMGLAAAASSTTTTKEWNKSDFDIQLKKTLSVLAIETEPPPQGGTITKKEKAWNNLKTHYQARTNSFCYQRAISLMMPQPKKGVLIGL